MKKNASTKRSKRASPRAIRSRSIPIRKRSQRRSKKSVLVGTGEQRRQFLDVLQQQFLVLVDLLEPPGEVGLGGIAQFVRGEQFLRFRRHPVELKQPNLPLQPPQVLQQQVAVAPEHQIPPMRLRLLQRLVGDAAGGV